MKNRIISLVVCAAILLGLIPAHIHTAHAATENDGLTTSKTVADNGDGTFTVTVTAYATGVFGGMMYDYANYQYGTGYESDAITEYASYYYVDAEGNVNLADLCDCGCGYWYNVVGDLEDTYYHTSLWPNDPDPDYVTALTPRTHPEDDDASHTQFYTITEWYDGIEFGGDAIPSIDGLDDETSLDDVVSGSFDLVGNVKTYVAEYNGSGFDAPVEASFSVSTSGKKVSVTGFNYNQECIVPGAAGGSQIVVTYDIEPAIDGADTLYAVGGSSAGIYNDGSLLENLPDAYVYLGTAPVEEIRVPNMITDKTVSQTPNADGTYTVTLKAYLESAPTDIVLVFDRSGSTSYALGDTTILDALKEAATNFIDAVAATATENSKEFNISLITFAQTAATEVALADGGNGNYDAVKTAISEITSAELLSTDDGTMINTGLEAAIDQIETEPGTGRNRVVVVFTDGIPGTGRGNICWGSSRGAAIDTAEKALDAAYTLKNTYDADVYTIGLMAGLDSTLSLPGWNNPGTCAYGYDLGSDGTDESKYSYYHTCHSQSYDEWNVNNANVMSEAALAETFENTNRFLHLLSSNYPRANGAMLEQAANLVAAEGDFYMSATTAAELSNVFTTISDTIEATTMNLDPITQIQDWVNTNVFNAVANSIKAYTAAYDGDSFGAWVPQTVNQASASAYSSRAAGAETYTGGVVTEGENEIVTLSGFDFTNNSVTPGIEGGNQLVVTYDIAPDTAASGTVNVDNQTDSGVYYNSRMVAAIPTANVALAANSGDGGSTGDGLVLDKNAAYDSATGLVTITMEAYATGTAGEGANAPVSELIQGNTYYAYNDSGDVIVVTYCEGVTVSHDAGWYSSSNGSCSYAHSTPVTPVTSQTDYDYMNRKLLCFTSYAAAESVANGGAVGAGATVTADNTALTADAELKDWITDSFESISNATVSYQKYTGSGWADAAAPDGAPTTATVDTASGLVSVTGFDFAANAVAEGTEHGYKMIVTFTVEPKDGVTGEQTTNTTDSGIYVGDTAMGTFTPGTVNLDGSSGEGGGGTTTPEIPEPDWEYTGGSSTEGLVTDKTITDNGDGTYTVTTTVHVTGTAEVKPAGAVYAEDLDPTQSYYAINAGGYYRRLDYCSKCGEWYIVAGDGFYWGSSYIMTAYANCATNHTYTGVYTSYYDVDALVGTFIPVGKYSNTTENASSVNIQPLTVWFYTSQSAADAATSGTGSSRRVTTQTTVNADLDGIGAETVLADTISKYFNYVDGSASVTVQTYSNSGWTDSGTLEATVDGKAIKVTGYNYSENCYVTDSGWEQGGQVVLTYKVTAGGATGTGGVFPVGTDRAGVYEDDTLATMLALLPNPTVRFAREDDSNVEIKEQDGLVLEKTATDNQDGTYTITLSGYVTGVLTEIEGTVYSGDLSTSRTYFVYNKATNSAMEVEYCSRCREWWQADTWHIAHYLASRESYKFIPRTDAADTDSSHDQFFETIDAARNSGGNASAVTENLNLGTSAVLEDIISDYFVLDGSVGVYTSYYNGSYFGALASSGLTADISADGSTIRVDGFDYAANAVAEGTRGGNRLVVTFDVVPKDGVLGTVPTNGVDSGVYNSGAVVAHFPRPTVNVVEYTGGGDIEETPEMNMSGLELDKVLTANGDGTYSIDLEAFTSGAVTTTNGVPLDVVFVLDRSYESNNYSMNGYWSFRWFWPTWNSSSSISTGMLQLAKGGITDMIMTLQNDANATGMDHRVSLISYAGEAALVEGLTDVNQTTLITAGDEDSGKLWDITSPSQNTGNTTDGMTRDNGNGSQIDLALQEAVNVFGAETDSSRKKVVIVLTGSIPGDGWGNKTWGGGNAVKVANDALVQAQILKDMGAEIYTVGLYNNANAFGEPADAWSYVNEDTYYDQWNSPSTNDYKNTNRFLHFLSSDLTTGITDVQATISTYKSAVYDWDDGYAGGGDTVDEACVAFEFINNTVVAPIISLDGTTVLKDQVTKYFDIVGGVSGITVNKVDVSSGAVTNITDEVTVTLSDGMVSVSGYDYGANNVTGDSGSKLQVSFVIKPKDGFVGGNNVPTNVAATSGAYIPTLWCDSCQSGADIGTDGNCECGAAAQPILPTAPTANFGASPEANVTIEAPAVTGADAVINYGDSVDGLKLYHGIDTVTDGWKYDYVKDITYSVSGTVDNTQCGTYTVTATVSPKEEAKDTSKGTGAVSASSTAEATVHVTTPHISVTDAAVYWGDSVNVSTYVAVSGWSCEHGEKAETTPASTVTLSIEGGVSSVTPDDCATYEVYASVGGDVLSTSTMDVHVIKATVPTEDTTIYLSQSADLTALAPFTWNCDTHHIANGVSQDALMDLILGTAPMDADDLTYSDGETITGSELTAYAPEDCTTVTVTGSYSNKGKTADISESLTVHVLQPSFAVETKNVWADYGVVVDFETWGVTAIDDLTYSWVDVNGDGGKTADEMVDAEGNALSVPELTIDSYVFDQGTNGKHTTTAKNLTVNVTGVSTIFNGEEKLFSLSNKSFTITTNKFDLVLNKSYTSTDAGSYLQSVVYKLTDVDAGMSISLVGEDDGSTKVVGLLCGKDYTVTEDTKWAWRYSAAATNNGAVSCTNSISNAAPGELTVTVAFTNTLVNRQWMSRMSVTENLFQ